MTLPRCFRRFMVLLLIALVAGCAASSAVSYYSLGALPATPAAPQPQKARPAIGIANVMLPDYLDRPQLVTRSDAHQLRVEEFHRWAGRLQDEISRVLLENLRMLGASQRIDRAPWPAGFKPGLIVTVQLTTFEAFPDGTVRLIGSVTLADLRPSAAPVSWNVHLQEPAAGRGPSDLVAAQSRLVEALSRQINEAIAHRP
ncbi:MAG: membrane integrity-associated transporter subunit PqiC [Desulfatitalea sp.]|nr:membrane integrity-associated transporter subunit PqiC [Desulfatitalea sp.]